MKRSRGVPKTEAPRVTRALRRGDTVLVKSVFKYAPPEIVGLVTGFEDSGQTWVQTYIGGHLYDRDSIIKTLAHAE